MAATQAFFDLCHRPEYIAALREELLQVLHEDEGFKKTTLTKLRKLDSVMRESQRLSPPSLLGFKRTVRFLFINARVGKSKAQPFRFVDQHPAV
ncbi:MAG: hypothetical protein Q9157_002924 [Trypethelium eluteriae]